MRVADARRAHRSPKLLWYHVRCRHRLQETRLFPFLVARLASSTVTMILVARLTIFAVTAIPTVTNFISPIKLNCPELGP